MAPPRDDDWSDSDEEELSEVETSVLLGVPDGAVQSTSDLTDAAVSRIGGHPAFLPSREPSMTSSQCKVCSNPSELLVQMWCPFEDSPMDRALYIWGCARASCQCKDGSVRAWRGLRRNDKYAAKLEKKLAKKRAAEEAKARALAEAEQKKNAPKKNPFSMNGASAPHMFGIGAQVFGDSSSPAPAISAESPASEEEDVHEDMGGFDGDEESASSEDELLTAMASVTLAESPWKAAPSYPPLYLSTVPEYLAPQPKSKHPAEAQVTDPLDADPKGGKDISWASEAYEDSLEMDRVFERFTKRVSYEAEQCVRYELNGTPLPFSSDKIFTSLFPSPPAPTLPVTKAAFTVVHTPKRTYFPTNIPPCPSCGGKRVFECQLMPNLINVLRRPDDRKLSDEERRKAVERALKGVAEPDEARGMEWGTCMVFSCENDCCRDESGKEARECWREEVVLIQAAI
ncbi:putative programmed cell death protein 2, C-terminal domain [Lyophyllum shimeji]|uniref:Programmed cell death protein 2, C-terminal domain n=1 Tax=Lyophyllum shimeji TaxID=47721 RepID=A0A9P3PY85_LYOSH|nr:putative programmed cell death protein 2, C-terminal domain [Lyophyllum shimeji]